MTFGLVFAGGGARGAYHMGVWKALNEMKINICAVSGASIGAINGALFTQGSYDKALALWENVAIGNIVKLPSTVEIGKNLFEPKNLLKVAEEAYKNAGLDVKPLEELLNSIVDENAIRKSKIDFGLTAYSVTEKHPVILFKEDIPEGQLVQYLLASSCFPGFKPREIGKEKFIDGGITDNMPVDLMIKKGINNIITVDVKGVGFSKDCNTAGRNIIKIRCRRPHIGTMEFEHEGIKNSITEGYLDCKREFGLLFGDECYFNIKEYTKVHSQYGASFISGVQHAAKAFGIPTLREVKFDSLIKEVASAYLIEKEIRLSENTKLSIKDLILSGKLSKLDDKTVICTLAEILETDGYDFVKSKMDILGKYYDAASALLYLKNNIC